MKDPLWGSTTRAQGSHGFAVDDAIDMSDNLSLNASRSCCSSASCRRTYGRSAAPPPPHTRSVQSQQTATFAEEKQLKHLILIKAGGCVQGTLPSDSGLGSQTQTGLQGSTFSTQEIFTFFQFLSERMYKNSIYVISGLSSWLRKCAIIQDELIRAENQAVGAAARSKAVICFSELQMSTNSAVGVKETNK